MFLVGGTCIGAGMLALPVATGVNGFIPSLTMMFMCWLMMTATGLLFLEATLWMEEGSHVISMSSRFLGKTGKYMSWILFLFISYASIVAYTAAAGAQLSAAFDTYLGISLSKNLGCILFIIIFGAVVDAGSYVVGRVNSILFFAMIGAYVGLVGLGVNEIKVEYLLTHRWPGALMSIPLLLTVFSFQTMVPSLTPYLKKNVKSLRMAIIGGAFIAFLIYLIWQSLILGIVPAEGGGSLSEALSKGEPATQFLAHHTFNKWVVPLALYFSFFAIVTSFLGMSLGLFDFLADGLKIKKEGWGRISLGALIIIPTLIFATQFERVFLIALDTTGGFGDTVLNGMMPVLMVWVGRYQLHLPKQECLPGGKPLLVLIFIFFFAVFIFEVLALTGNVGSIYDAYEVFEHAIEGVSI